MAVITPSTFDALRRYVNVRLQQGVPIVDADWNELDDMRKFELRAFLRWFIGDGVPLGSDGFRIAALVAPQNANDFQIQANLAPGAADALRNVGRCVVEGLDVIITANLRFTEQELHASRGAAATALAARLGVPVIAALTPPAANQTVIAYLDVWERPVSPTDDPTLVLPGLGTESCARVRREWVVRTRVGTTVPVSPNPDFIAGHSYLALATIARRAGDPNVNAADITDVRQTRLNLADLTRRLANIERLVVIPAFDPADNFSPNIQAVGANLTLRGRNFTVGTPQVRFFNNASDLPATVIGTPTPTQIVAQVPVGAVTGMRLRVVNEGGSVESTETFTLL